MADGTFAVEVATPERQLLAGRARAVVTRSSEGDFTVLAGHAPLVADVVPGALRVDQPEGSALFCVHGGYLQVDRTSPEEAADLGTALGGGAHLRNLRRTRWTRCRRRGRHNQARSRWTR